VRDNVSVAIGQTLSLTRPYFYPQGISSSLVQGPPNQTTVTQDVLQGSDAAQTSTSGIAGTQETDPNYMPILTIPQDLAVLSPPNAKLPDSANNFEAGFPHIKLVFGVPAAEMPCASGGACAQSNAPGQTNPFHFQLGQTATSQSGISVWQNAYFDPTAQKWTPLQIPEGQGVPMLWPQVILAKLADSTDADGNFDSTHANDPASLSAQGAAYNPVVILQGITLLAQPQNNPLSPAGKAQGDTLLNTAFAAGLAGTNTLFDTTKGVPTTYVQDHLMVALRPSVICFNHLFDDPPAQDTRGVLVSPYSSNNTADYPNTAGPGPIVPVDLLNNGQVTSRFQVTNLVNSVQYGCLPKGRYSINVVYPDGQAWTVPNEAGSCSGTEGGTDYGGLTCSLKPRPLLYSQGNRAIVEIVGPSNPQSCVNPGPGPGAPQGPPGDPAPAGKPAFAVPDACLVTKPPQ
jgi:hypothetical protein